MNRKINDCRYPHQWSLVLLKLGLSVISSILFIIPLSSCHVGPDFVRPPAPEVTTYTKVHAAPHLIPGNKEPSQRLVVGKAIPVAWWRLFHSPSLDHVVREGIANNPTLAAARARLLEAQQSILMARGAFYPQFDATLSAQREKGPPLVFGLLPPELIHTYNLYSLGPMVSFVPDVFGLTARRVEQQVALAENQAYQLAAAQLTITGNIVSTALTIALVRSQIEATREIIASDVKNLALVRKRLNVGTVDRSDFLLAANQLEKDRATLPPLKQQMAAAQDALAILVGQSPAAWEVPHFKLDEFTLPTDLPLILPSKMVAQRPDILAAEATMHANSAAIGIAVGELLPTITLSASLTPTALTPGALFHRANLAWDAFAGMTAPIFHGGTLWAQKQAAIEAYRASIATYKQTVLEGLRQVADTLRALGHDAELVRAERRALNDAKAALQLTRNRFSVGTVSLLELLDAERSYQQARVSYAQAYAQRYFDSAQLFVALGGGWREELA